MWLLLACVPPTPNKPVDDTGFVYRHSEVVEDTDTGKESVDTTDSGDTADTSDTADSGDTGPQLVQAEVYPHTLTVAVGASWNAWIVTTDSDGLRVRTAADSWVSDDPTIATVDAAGTVQAVGPGTTQVHGAVGSVKGDATITVRDDGMLSVQILNATTGQPMELVHVMVGGTKVSSDASGFAEIPVADPGKIEVDVYKGKYEGVILTGTLSRSLVVYMNEIASSGALADVHGQVDFTGVAEADWDGVTVGIAGASVQGDLGSVIVDDFFAEDRTVTVLGFDVKVPGNLFLKGSAEDYYARAYPGPVASWSLAGPLKVADLPIGEGAGAALALISSNLGNFSFGYSGGGVAALDATAELDLAPATPFDDPVPVTLPALPTGFNGTERYFVMAAEEDANDGWIIDGFGSGLAGETVDVMRAAPGSVVNSVGSALLIYNQVGSLGNGGAVCSSVVDLDVPTAPVPALMEVPTIQWDSAAHTVGATVDPRASYVRLHLVGMDGQVWNIFSDTSWNGTLVDPSGGWDWKYTDLEVLALESSWGSFEDRAGTGIWEPRAQRASAMARAVMNN